jgi:hypothetical protein
MVGCMMHAICVQLVWFVWQLLQALAWHLRRVTLDIPYRPTLAGGNLPKHEPRCTLIVQEKACLCRLGINHVTNLQPTSHTFSHL